MDTERQVVNWIVLAQEYVQWWDFMMLVMNIWTLSYLTSCVLFKADLASWSYRNTSSLHKTMAGNSAIQACSWGGRSGVEEKNASYNEWLNMVKLL